MSEQEDSIHILKAVFKLVGLVVVVIWYAAMVFSFVFSVPDLPFPEFSLSGLGFYLLYYNLVWGIRKIERKVQLIIFVLYSIVGMIILSFGAFVILFVAPNIFASLCLITGAALIILNAKRMCINANWKEAITDHIIKEVKS